MAQYISPDHVIDEINTRLDELEQTSTTNKIRRIANAVGHFSSKGNATMSAPASAVDTAFIFFGGGLVKGLMEKAMKARVCSAKSVQVGSVRALTQSPEFKDPDSAVWEAHVSQWVDKQMTKISGELAGCRSRTVVMMAAEPDPTRFAQAMSECKPSDDLDAYADAAARHPMYRLNVGVPYKVAQWVAQNPGFNLLHISTSYVYMEEGPEPNIDGQPMRTIPPTAQPGIATGLHPFDQRNEQNGNVSEMDYAPYAPVANSVALWEGRAPVVKKMGSYANLIEFTKAALSVIPVHCQTAVRAKGVQYHHSKLLAELAVQSFSLNNGSAYTIVRLPTMVASGAIFGPRVSGASKYAKNILKAMTFPDKESGCASFIKWCPSWRSKSRSMCSFDAAADIIVGLGLGMQAASPPCFQYDHAAGSYSESDCDYHVALCQGVKEITPEGHPKQEWLDYCIAQLQAKDAEQTDVGAHTTMAMQNQSINTGFENDFNRSIAAWMKEHLMGFSDLW